MTPLRWSLVAAIVLAAGAAGLHLALREPGAPVAAGPAGVAARPLTLPTAEQHGTPTVMAAPASGAVAKPPAASVPTVPASSPRIGSEGYGPHIEIAHSGHDAAAAWEAVQWLRRCASNTPHRSSLEKVREQGIAPEMMTEMMVEADAEARRCQTVTAQHQAMLPELATRAMRAGVVEAASAYAGTVFAADLTAAQRQEVADAMRRDARAGHAASLWGAAMAHEAWGLSDTERLAFAVAYGQLQPGAQAMVESMLALGLIRFKAAPTAEQQANAKLLADQILERARAGTPP